MPELAFTGYVSPRGEVDVRGFAEGVDGASVEGLGEIAREQRAHVVGPVVLREGEALFNACVMVDPAGEVEAVYRKRHPWYPETWATPGREAAPVVRVGELLVTFAICFDVHFLEADAADALSRADLLVFPSAWVDEGDTRVPILADLARRFGVAIANANWGPGVVRVPGQGGSCILDATGAIVATVAPGARCASATVRPRRAPVTR